MPLLNDLHAVRAALDRDPEWAAYAIGDLGPGYVEHSQWYAPADASRALVLLYRGFDPPIVFAMGDPRHVRPLLEDVRAPEISLHIRPEALGALMEVYTPADIRRMLRMSLRACAFTPVPHEEVRRVGESHVAAVTALYDDGHRRGEGPTFFTPEMLHQHTFQGVWEDDALVAIAGTHLYSRDEGVCAIGNVYTRSDRRGRGLAGRVTSAVAAQAISDGIPTIVLNVSVTNDAARRVYERLGFATHCEFLEGEATRQNRPITPARTAY